MKKQLIILFSFFLSSAIAQTTHSVNAGNYYFTDITETVYVGDQICWFNDGGYHDVNFSAVYGNPQELVDQYLSPNSGGELGCITFNTAGAFTYDCSIGSHAAQGMVATITVSPSPDCLDDDATIESLFSGGMSISTCSAAIDYLANNYGYSTSQSCSWDGSPGFNFGEMTLADYCECSCENTMFIDKIESNLEEESYLFTLDIFGRKISKNGPVAIVFDFYSSGKVVKRVRAE